METKYNEKSKYHEVTFGGERTEDFIFLAYKTTEIEGQQDILEVTVVASEINISNGNAFKEVNRNIGKHSDYTSFTFVVDWLDLVFNDEQVSEEEKILIEFTKKYNAAKTVEYFNYDKQFEHESIFPS